ncbi:MAG: hypothetical protein ACOXZH_06265 [Bacteroidales bacterium]|nr:hypothetical protein [Bacteroidales bacterium]
MKSIKWEYNSKNLILAYRTCNNSKDKKNLMKWMNYCEQILMLMIRRRYLKLYFNYCNDNGLLDKKIEYIKVMDGVYNFADKELSEKFRNYHKEKANLRLVKKGKNLGRSHQARINRQQKDLTIE